MHFFKQARSSSKVYLSPQTFSTSHSESYRWILTEPSPPASFSTSATVTML